MALLERETLSVVVVVVRSGPPAGANFFDSLPVKRYSSLSSFKSNGRGIVSFRCCFCSYFVVFTILFLSLTYCFYCFIIFTLCRLEQENFIKIENLP